MEAHNKIYLFIEYNWEIKYEPKTAKRQQREKKSR